VDNHVTARTALSDVQTVEGMHSLSENPLCGKINLRGDINNPSFTKGVEEAIGLSLAIEANTTGTSPDRKIFWLGPDEWLLHLPLQQLEKTLLKLEQALAEVHCAITDVSDYYSVLELSGPQSREVIASASVFDTREAEFTISHCAQIRFGHASILLWPLTDIAGFGLQVRWSYAQYVYDYLAQSIRNTQSLSRFNDSD
jgi:sarcosine oxidase subunit gamma